MSSRKIMIMSIMVSVMLMGCSAKDESVSSITETSSSVDNVEDVEEVNKNVVPNDVKQSPDKYTYYVKDYTNMNLASIGYYSLGGELLDKYGGGQIKINYVTPQGTYIDIEDEEDKKNYVVVAQSVTPNTELKYTFEKDSDGNEFDNLVAFQTIESIDLAVIKVGSDETSAQLVEIKPSKDKYNMYIRNYVGKNLASIGYYSLGGDILDSYGDGKLNIIFVTDDGSFINPEDREAQRAYVVTGQNIEPNTPLLLTYLKDSDGQEYDNLVDSQNYETINLNVKKLENADEILNTASMENDVRDENEKNDDTTDESESKDGSSADELVDGMRPEFKKAMDSYEDFYDEYCNMLKKYNNNPTDTEIMSSYTKLLEKQAKVDEDFKKWDGDMNDAEFKYYMEVYNRVMKKLTDTYQ